MSSSELSLSEIMRMGTIDEVINALHKHALDLTQKQWCGLVTNLAEHIKKLESKLDGTPAPAPPAERVPFTVDMLITLAKLGSDALLCTADHTKARADKVYDEWTASCIPESAECFAALEAALRERFPLGDILDDIA